MAIWQVGLAGDEYVLRVLADKLKQDDMRIIQEDGTYFLVAHSFEGLENSRQVREKARPLIRALQGLIKLELNVSASLGDAKYVRLAYEDGRRSAYIAIDTIVQVAIIPGVTAVGTTADGQIVQTQTSLNNYEKHSNRMQQDSEIADVLSYFGNDGPKAFNLGKVFELISDYVGGEAEIIRKGWASRAQITRFTNSINNRKVLGLEARHATLKREPPSKPMSLSDAENFITGLVRQWLEWKEES